MHLKFKQFINFAGLRFSDVEATSNDYDNTDKIAQFSSTTNIQNVDVTIINDECFENPETFQVNLDNLDPSCNAASGLPKTMTIIDDDCKYI